MSTCLRRKQRKVFEQTGTRTRLFIRILNAMNYLISLRAAAVAGLVFAAPATGLAKDKHYHNSGPWQTSYVQPYCAPHVSHGFRPTYYSRPSVSVGFYTAPAYYSAPAYYYDPYPATRVYYSGVPRTSYSYRASSSYSDELAVDVQRALARRGYYRGGIDGDIGPGTRAAIRSYQYNRGLEVTGRIDGALLRSLGIS